MPHIRRTTFEEAEAVTVRLLQDPDGPTGVVTLPEGSEPVPRAVSGRIEIEIDPSGAPAAEVVAYAKAKADEAGCDLAVIDADDLWDVAWGDLPA